MKMHPKEVSHYFEFPYITQDFFIIETLNAGLSILDNILTETQKEFHVEISHEEAKDAVIKSVSHFHKSCLKCENDCFSHYHKRLPPQAYQQMNIDMDNLPKAFHKVNAAHFYMLEVALACSGSLSNFAESYTSNEDALEYLHHSLFFSLIDYFSDNRIKDCNYSCFKKNSANSYCQICTLFDEDLDCPLKGEVTLEDIDEDVFPSECLKK